MKKAILLVGFALALAAGLGAAWTQDQAQGRIAVGNMIEPNGCQLS